MHKKHMRIVPQHVSMQCSYLDAMRLQFMDDGIHFRSNENKVAGGGNASWVAALEATGAGAVRTFSAMADSVLDQRRC